MIDKGLVESAKNVDIKGLIEQLGISIYNNKLHCPFHKHDRVPSLQIYPNTNTYYCWGCGKYGDSISFVMNYYGCSFENAVLKLTGQSSITNNKIKQKKINKKQIKKASQTEIHEVYKYLFDNLELTEKGYNYLTSKRKLSPEIISKYNIKSIDDYKPIYNKMLEKFGMLKLIKTGIASFSSKTKSYYFTFFLPSIIFPHIHIDKYVYAHSRSYENKSFIKPQTIIPRVFTGNIFATKIVVVESAICALSYEMLTGRNNFIAVTSANIKKIKKILDVFAGREIILMLDNDETALTIYQMLEKDGYNINVVNPNDFAKQFGATKDIKDINDILLNVL